jgi:hypothetical protein
VDIFHLFLDYYFSLPATELREQDQSSSDFSVIVKRVRELADLFPDLGLHQLEEVGTQSINHLLGLRATHIKLPEIDLAILFAWQVIQGIEDTEENADALISLLSTDIAGKFSSDPTSPGQVKDKFSILPIITDILIGLDSFTKLPLYWFNDQDLRQYLNVNIYKDISWFNQEAIESLLNLSVGLLVLSPPWSLKDAPADLDSFYNLVLSGAAESSYQEKPFLDKFNAQDNGIISRSK